MRPMRRNPNRLALAVSTALALGVGSHTLAQVIDGTLDATGYTRFATQTVNTGFGDNQSELNAGYFRIDGGKLYLMITGNLESNNNKLVFFFDTKAGGQNVMRTDNPDVSFNQLNDKYGGMTHDAGFEPDYFLSISRDRPGGAEGSMYIDFSELNTTGGGSGGYAGRMDVPADQILINGRPSGGNDRGVPRFTFGYNDSNTAGVSGDAPNAADPVAAEAVTTGFEVVLDLAQIGATGNFKMFTGVNGSSHDYWSNQFLPGLVAPQGNLGGDGLGNFTGTVSGVNFGNFAGDQFVEFTYAAPASTAWNNAGNGAWGTGGNWSGGTAPVTSDATAVLGTAAGSAARTITLDVPVALKSLTFDSAGGYTIDGTNALTVASAAADVPVNVLSGNHTINAPVVTDGTFRVNAATGTSLTIAGTFTADEVVVVKEGDGTLGLPSVGQQTALVVAGGTARINPNGTATGVSRPRRLEIAGGSAAPTATFDLTNNGLVLDYTPPEPTIEGDNNSPLAETRDLIISGRAGGAWTGTGITSSSAAANSSTHGIGIAEASDVLGETGGVFMGQIVDESTVLARYTRLGDANLDGTTGIADFSRLAANFNQPGGWSNGDFNYDGQTAIADFSLLAANFNLSAGGVVSRPGAVPEPATLGLVALGGLALLGRRGRRA